MKDKVVIVTGGAGGIGSVICKTLVREGAIVAVVDLAIGRAKSVVREATLGGDRALAMEVDVTNQEAVETAVERVVDRYGRIDCLVHCAGNNVKGSFLELTLDQWQSTLDIHLTGAFLFCQAVGRQLVLQGKGGKIVLMSSVAAMNPVPERGAYSPSKAALVNLAKLLCLEWACYNINVNAVCPGVAETPMTRMVYERDPALEAQRLKRMPMGRHVLPQEIADLVVFLCGDKSSYNNGAAIPIDGGFLHSGFLPE